MTQAQAHELPATLDLGAEGGGRQGVTELVANLLVPTTRLTLSVRGGTLGRAEALFGGSNWAAANYWSEPDRGDGGTRVVFEWSEALPAGEVRLRLPYHR